MSGEHQAVFLSYASQDAEAARCICEALRATGIEVWFDQSELRGGDAWDQKIRKQIKDCALFVPIISANTQKRHEGYFRLEWHLAEQRSHLIARGRPFILPVAVDGTNDADALVPDAFLAVQWIRLPEGNVPAGFCERVKALLSGPVEEGRPFSPNSPGGRVPVQTGAAPAAGGRSRLLVPAVLLGGLAILVLGAVAYLVLRPRRSPEEIAKLLTVAQSIVGATVVKSGGGPAPSAAPLSEARQLAARARALFGPLDTTRDDCALAGDLLKQAMAADATDAEVWAAEAQLDEYYLVRGWDTSDARRESARVAAQRAFRIDPKSFEARFARAELLGTTGREAEERERLLRELRGEQPADQRVLRALASTIDLAGRLDEAIALDDESARLPGGDPLALYNKSLNLWFAGRTAEAEAAMRAAIAQKPFTGALLMTVWYATALHGDLDRARATLERIDPAALQEDRGCYFAFYVDYLRRDPDAALARLQAVPRDWLNDFWYRGPKSRLIGDALQLAGRPEAAAVEWRAGLKLVEARLAGNPTVNYLLYNRILLLASLGEQEEAARQFSVLLQMTGINPSGDSPVPTWVTDACIALGRKREAMRQIAHSLKQVRHAVVFTAATLRLDPFFDSLRGEPEFQQLITDAAAIENGSTPATAPAVGTVAPAPDQKSVAVLAFANLSDDKENEYFADGISEKLLTALQKIPGLRSDPRWPASLRTMGVADEQLK